MIPLARILAPVWRAMALLSDRQTIAVFWKNGRASRPGRGRGILVRSTLDVRGVASIMSFLESQWFISLLV